MLFTYSERASGLAKETNASDAIIDKMAVAVPIIVSSILVLYCIILTTFSIGAATTDLSSMTVGIILITDVLCWTHLVGIGTAVAIKFRWSKEEIVALLWRAVKIMTVYLFVTAYVSGSSMALSIALNGIYGDPVRMREILLVVMLVEVLFSLSILVITKCVVTVYLAHFICLFGCLFFGTVVGVTLSFSHERNPNIIRFVLGAMLFCEICITIILYYLFKRRPARLGPAIELALDRVNGSRIISQPVRQGEYTILADDPGI